MDKELINALKSEIDNLDVNMTFMEVCGTHTMSIGKIGLRSILGEKVKLISGPGCPVCVTPSNYIDYVYALSLHKSVSVITYGDMLRVPGSSPSISLEKAKALGADIRIVYSAIDSIDIALNNKDKQFVFLGIGFETTIPSTCILLDEIISKKIRNLKIMSLHKRVEPVMKKLIEDSELNIDGFLCPGNVAVIIGEKGFKFLENYKKLGVIGGFEGDDIISSIIELICNRKENKYTLLNNYGRFVNYDGNELAMEFINRYFEFEKAPWRGIGIIEDSGYRLKSEFKEVDIFIEYPLDEVIGLINYEKKKYICKCGEILKGKISPKECESFGDICNPSFPIGPCMVSSEGTCSAYYKYERR